MSVRLLERIEKMPKGVIVALAVVALVGIVWFRWSRGGAEKYPQEPILLRCTACRFQEKVSVDDYVARIQKEKPDGRDLVEGPELTCPKCKKMAVLPAQSEDAEPKSAPPPQPSEEQALDRDRPVRPVET